MVSTMLLPTIVIVMMVVTMMMVSMSIIMVLVRAIVVLAVMIMAMMIVVVLSWAWRLAKASYWCIHTTVSRTIAVMMAIDKALIKELARATTAARVLLVASRDVLVGARAWHGVAVTTIISKLRWLHGLELHWVWRMRLKVPLHRLHWLIAWELMLTSVHHRRKLWMSHHHWALVATTLRGLNKSLILFVHSNSIERPDPVFFTTLELLYDLLLLLNLIILQCSQVLLDHEYHVEQTTVFLVHLSFALVKQSLHIFFVLL